MTATITAQADDETIGALILDLLGAATTPMRTADVAEQLRGNDIRQSDIYRALARLERDGAIVRHRDPAATRPRDVITWQVNRG